VLDLLLAGGTVAVVVVYARGWSRSTTPPGRVLAFAGGLAVVLVAVASPLERAAETSLTDHMAQHVLLLVVAPPLLVAARPGRTLARGAPRALAAVVRAGGRATRHLVGTHAVALPLGAVALQAALVGIWHLPGPFDAAAHDGALHALEHASYLASSLVLWSAVAWAARRGLAAAALLCLFATALVCTALGAAMTLAPAPWYSVYAHGRAGAALADQQLAGVVMWGFSNVALVVAAVALFGRWLADLERRIPSRLRPDGLR
jgi:cytochrome c oxidase assembly factor CtaG